MVAGDKDNKFILIADFPVFSNSATNPYAETVLSGFKQSLL